MPRANDIRHFQCRENAARLAARHAPTPALKELLEVTADRYADWVWALEEEEYDQRMGSCDDERTVVFEASFLPLDVTPWKRGGSRMRDY